jgi:hypothetical protein
MAVGFRPQSDERLVADHSNPVHTNTKSAALRFTGHKPTVLIFTQN